METKENKKLEILVVEDKYDCSRIADETLTKKGYKVIHAYDLEGALNILENNTPDAVLTDMCFHEKGIDGGFTKKGKTLISNGGGKYPIEENDPYMHILNKGTKEEYDIHFSFKAWDDADKIKLLESIVTQEKTIYGLMSLSGYYTPPYDIKKIDGFKEGLIALFEKSNPPMGHYVIEKCKEKKLPVIGPE